FSIRCRLLALLLTFGAPAAHGQQSPAVPTDSAETAGAAGEPAADPAHVRRLIETLEDPARRDELLASLRALLAAQERAEPADDAAPEETVAAAADLITDRAEALGRAAVRMFEALGRIPAVFTWLQAEWRDPARRALWLEVGVAGLVVLGLGTVAYQLIWLALTPVRRRLALGARRGALARAIRLPLRLLADLLPVLAFALVAYPTLDLVQPTGVGRVALVPLIEAVILAQAAMALVRRVFSPGTPELRAFSMPDDAARAAVRWSGRVIRTWLYGHAILEAARRLGLPRDSHALLSHLLFLAVAVVVAVLIVAIRHPVRARIASLAEERRSPLVRWLPWRAIGAIWHVLALAYLLFLCLVWAFGIPGGFQAVIVNTLASIAIALVAALVLSAMGRWPHRGTVPEADAPLVERRLRRYRAWLPLVGRALVVLAAALALFEVWGVGVLDWLRSETGQIALGRLVTIALVVIFTFVVWEGISLAIERSVSER